MAKETSIKSDIHEMAEKLGIKKENLEVGLSLSPKATEEAIKKAYDFKFKRK